MAGLQIKLFGQFSVTVDGQPAPEEAWRGERSRSLLQFLATRPNLRATTEQIVDALWPHLAPDNARSNLHVTASRLRRALHRPGTSERDGEALLATSTGYQLEVDTAVDLAQFFEHVAAVQAAVADLGLRGLDRVPNSRWEALPELSVDQPYADWAVAEQQRVRLAYLTLKMLEGELLQRSDRPAQALAAFQQALEIDPTLESAASQGMRAAVALGQRTAALRIFDRLRQSLSEELGVDPSPEMVELNAQILNETLAPAAAALQPERPQTVPGDGPQKNRIVPVAGGLFLLAVAALGVGLAWYSVRRPGLGAGLAAQAAATAAQTTAPTAQTTAPAAQVAAPAAQTAAVTPPRDPIEQRIADLTSEIATRPAADLFFQRGELYMHQKRDYTKAIVDYTTAIELRPNWLQPYIGRCTSYNRIGKPELAIPDCERALALGDPHYAGHREKGIAYMIMRRYQDAIESFTKVLWQAPSPLYYSERAEAYLAAGLLKEAAADLVRANSLGEAAQYQHRLGQVYLRAEQWEDAVKALSRTLELDPNRWAALADRGRAYHGKGEIAKARADYEMILKTPAAGQYHQAATEQLNLLKEVVGPRSPADRGPSLGFDMQPKGVI